MDSQPYPHPSWIRTEALAVGAKLAEAAAKAKKPTYAPRRSCKKCNKQLPLNKFEPWQRTCNKCLDSENGE